VECYGERANFWKPSPYPPRSMADSPRQSLWRGEGRVRDTLFFCHCEERVCSGQGQTCLTFLKPSELGHYNFYIINFCRANRQDGWRPATTFFLLCVYAKTTSFYRGWKPLSVFFFFGIASPAFGGLAMTMNNSG